ncbi:MAG: Wzz/FepE/Etk N-terminal domain-containing protein [Gemmatimonadota bacterium]|nr:Wzz/FepE/Etk N-terminal domain-containing protein [Gemmatimonadota bacterium]
MDERKVSFLDYIYTWLKWRRLIIWMVSVASILALAISFILPKKYLASTTILPPKEESPLGLSTPINTLTSGLNILGLGESEELDTYMAILLSRRVRESVVRTYNLQAYFNKKTMDEALKSLDSSIDIEVTKENSLMLSVIHKDSVKAAEIANFFVAELDRINKSLNNDQARSNRMFIERRLSETRQHLAQAEEAMRVYQEENSTLGLSDENRAALLAGAELEARVMALEVQKDVLRKSFGSSHPLISQIQSEIDASKNRLVDLPEIGLDMARLLREVEIQTTLLTFLLPQYELAKIEEVKDTPTLQIVDPAVPPQIKHSPKRIFIVLGAFFSSLLIGLIIALNLESIQQARAEKSPRGRRIEQILMELRSLSTRRSN